MPEIRVATRASALARTQSQAIADALGAATGRPVRLVLISTEGDRSSAPIEAFGTTGVFVAAVRQALLDGSADIAVHSLKDLPTAPEPGLRLAAVPTREDPRDALCGMSLAELPAGARVGTGSPRRQAQLLALRPDLDIVPLRGNVDTRLSRAASGELAAVVLAAAGLHRLGRADAIAQYLDPESCTPAPAQGALAVECREDLRDTELLAALADLDDAGTRAAVAAERSLLRTLEAGCTAPVGALAAVTGSEITLQAVAAEPRGTAVVRTSDTAPAERAEQLGQAVAAQLLAAGAAELMGEKIP